MTKLGRNVTNKYGQVFPQVNCPFFCIFNTNNLYMASFDIENLFTNVPVMETIEIIINKISVDPHATFLGLSKA